MSQKYFLQELDEATREYLLAVRDAEGERMPGVFVPRTNYLPIVGVIVGPILIIAVLIFTLGSVDDPVRTALLQTAALLLGGWLVVAAVRVWVMQRGRNYLGHFVYVDSAWLYEAKGSTVTIASLKNLLGAEGTDHYNEGAYQSTAVEVRLAKDGGNGRILTVCDQEQARRLVTFLNALAYVRTGSAGDVSNLSTWDVGQTAIALADNEPAPNLEQKPRIARELGDIPEPQRVGRAPQALLACGTIVLAGVAIYLLMHTIAIPLRDDAIFNLVKDRRPPVLRSYLVDARNTRHREEVEKRLGRFYVQPLADINKHGQDPDLKAVFAELVTGLATAVQPVVSLRVKEKNSTNRTDGVFDLASAVEPRTKAVERRLVDSLTLTVSDMPGAHDRDDMIALGGVPNDVPAMIEIGYTFAPEQGAAGLYRLEWTVELRDRPDARPVRKTWTAPQAVQANAKVFLLAVEEQARQTLLKMTGNDRGSVIPGAAVSYLHLEGGLGNVNAELSTTDPRDRLRAGSHCKVYTLDMMEGRTYQIELASGAFDAFLRIESPEGAPLAEDDNGGGGRNARLVFVCPRSGRYCVIATSFNPGGAGPFSLRVEER